MEESETTAPNNKDFQFTQQQTTLLFVLHIQHSLLLHYLIHFMIFKRNQQNEVKKKNLVGFLLNIKENMILLFLYIFFFLS